jgi:hypothetical protein
LRAQYGGWKTNLNTKTCFVGITFKPQTPFLKRNQKRATSSKKLFRIFGYKVVRLLSYAIFIVFPYKRVEKVFFGFVSKLLSILSTSKATLCCRFYLFYAFATLSLFFVVSPILVSVGKAAIFCCPLGCKKASAKATNEAKRATRNPAPLLPLPTQKRGCRLFALPKKAAQSIEPFSEKRLFVFL